MMDIRSNNRLYHFVWFFLLFFIALIIFIGLQRLSAHSDSDWFRSWTLAANQYGYSYTALRQYSSFNYLPAFIPFLWLSNRVESLTNGLGLTLPFVIVWRSLFFVFGSLLVVWLIQSLRSYLNYSQKLWLAGLFLFSPFFVWVMWVWGQVDLVMILPWLLSLIYLAQRRYGWFVVLTGMVVLIKPTGLLLLPLQGLLFFIQWLNYSRFSDMKRFGTGILFVGLLFVAPLLPFIIHWLSIQAAWTPQTAVTYNAYNFWFLLRPNGSAQTVWHGLTFQLWGGLAFALLLLSSTARLFKVNIKELSGSQRLGLYSSFAFLYTYGFVFLLTDMHERYWDFPLAALILAAIYYQPWRWLLGVVSLTFFLNLILIFPSSVPLFMRLQSHWFQLGIDISWVHAGIFCLALILWVNLSNHGTVSRDKS